jgi:hypothetical protein
VRLGWRALQLMHRVVRQQPMTPSRTVVPLLLLALTACTASWGRLVRYSNEPAPPGESLVIGVYREVIPDEPGERYTVELLPPKAHPPELAAFTGVGASVVPGYWADTLKREVRAALADAEAAGEPSAVELEAAASALGLRIASQPVQAAPADSPSVVFVRLSRPGFNHDSTIAVVAVQVFCGILCGNGSVLLLARRPGQRWHVWYRALQWVS